MNIYKNLNEITEYIDENLEEKINYDVLAKMLGLMFIQYKDYLLRYQESLYLNILEKEDYLV